MGQRNQVFFTKKNISKIQNLKKNSKIFQKLIIFQKIKNKSQNTPNSQKKKKNNLNLKI